MANTAEAANTAPASAAQVWPASRGHPEREGNSTCVVIANDLCACDRLRRVLSRRNGFVLLRRHGSAVQLLLECRKAAPCVLLIDRDCLEAADPVELAGIAEFGRVVQVLVLGCKDDASFVETALRTGCMGYLREDASPALLKRAIRAVASGEFWASRKLISRMLQDVLAASGARRLTPRETDVLQLIGSGLSNRKIAETLSISRETVRWHIRSLYAKLDLDGRGAAVLYAKEFLHEELSVRRSPACAATRLAAGAP